MNLYSELPTGLPEELVETVLAAKSVRIERMVSHRHASPSDFWYDQNQHEWVVVLTGAAKLRFENELIERKAGDCINSPSTCDTGSSGRRRTNRQFGWQFTVAEPKGKHLFVNVGASEARRRLKGFGHGVRKVQSAGKNQAVVIHIATGRNLVELEAKFAEVGFSHNELKLSEPIQNLRNLGPTSAAWLRDVGVITIAELERLGPVVAYRLVKQKESNVNLNLLWAMAAGLADKDWRELREETKERLRKEAEEE